MDYEARIITSKTPPKHQQMKFITIFLPSQALFGKFLNYFLALQW